MIDMREKLSEGKEAPDFNFDTPWTQNQRFHDYLADGKTILIFLRYMGCPICQMRISSLRNDWTRFKAKGVNVLLVLQSTPENITSVVSKADIPFTIVCDPEEKIFGQYKVTGGNLFQYAAPSVLSKVMEAKKAGIEHGPNEGNERQLPAVFLINEEKQIRHAYYGKNVGDSPDNEELLQLVDRVFSAALINDEMAVEYKEIDSSQIKLVEPLFYELMKFQKSQAIWMKKGFDLMNFEKRIINELGTFKESRIILVTDDEMPIGFAYTSLDMDNSGKLKLFYLKDVYRGRGIGSRLCEDALCWLKSKHAEKIIVFASNGNTRAFKFYENKGFKFQRNVWFGAVKKYEYMGN
ncbi:MAG: GNAT family N-acetyltransferase [Spirochaetales bacterium]|nr:GNAT family N-acetyltransferase [Spirochaetales bacterium]